MKLRVIELLVLIVAVCPAVAATDIYRCQQGDVAVFSEFPCEDWQHRNLVDRLQVAGNLLEQCQSYLSRRLKLAVDQPLKLNSASRLSVEVVGVGPRGLLQVATLLPGQTLANTRYCLLTSDGSQVETDPSIYQIQYQQQHINLDLLNLSLPNN